MDQCGFDAAINTDASQMTMHECPFSELAKDNPQVCQVHFALVKDALQLMDGPLEALAVHPEHHQESP
jgi:predicted ArsR family transcriptional regulator